MIHKELHPKIWRLFDQLNAAHKVDDLNFPPGNRLEKLQGDLKDLWSVRINNQWRMVFIWEEGNAFGVDLVDYH